MNSEKFSAGDWIDRLAQELQGLAEAQKPYLRGLCCKPDEGARWSGRITCSP